MNVTLIHGRSTLMPCNLPTELILKTMHVHKIDNTCVSNWKTKLHTT